MKKTLLICDDEASLREVLSLALAQKDLEILTASSPMEALTLMRDHWVDLVLSDLRMPGMDGIAFLKQSKQEFPRIRFLMMSAFGSMETVIEAMRLGAADFLTKPVDIHSLRNTIARHLCEVQHENKANILPAQEKVPDASESSGCIIGTSENVRSVFARAQKAAFGEASVLITGESGTGKEVLARWIHNKSAQKDAPFIAINCGAIPENLIESELFGHEKGAFTGANVAKAGKFELAQGGTLFLDEVGELPLLAQVKLLRAIQERKIDRVGGSEPISVQFRLIAATHRNLEQMVEDQRFRSDLYYRLNVIPLELPPLRARGEDIFLLAQSVLDRLNERYNTTFTFNPEQKENIRYYPWPGNVRELENVLERAVVLSGPDELEIEFPQAKKIEDVVFDEGRSAPKERAIRPSLEREKIIEALDICRWNKTKTAEYLGISRRSLLYKIKDFEIE